MSTFSPEGLPHPACSIRQATTPCAQLRAIYVLNARTLNLLNAAWLITTVLLSSLAILASSQTGPIVPLMLVMLTTTATSILANLGLITLYFVVTSGQGKTIWCLEQHDQCIGVAGVSQLPNHGSLLFLLKIRRRDQRRGWGTYFIQYLCRTLPQPIYVFTHHQSAAFFRRLGFTAATRAQLPSQFQPIADDVMIYSGSHR